MKKLSVLFFVTVLMTQVGNPVFGMSVFQPENTEFGNDVQEQDCLMCLTNKMVPGVARAVFSCSVPTATHGLCLECYLDYELTGKDECPICKEQGVFEGAVIVAQEAAIEELKKQPVDNCLINMGLKKEYKQAYNDAHKEGLRVGIRTFAGSCIFPSLVYYVGSKKWGDGARILCASYSLYKIFQYRNCLANAVWTFTPTRLGVEKITPLRSLVENDAVVREHAEHMGQ